jgi:site-specific recombinase XerD
MVREVEVQVERALYSADAFARLCAMRPIAGELLREDALSFCHTFGLRAVARDMSIDVVQRILGHALLQTTSIYVRAERQCMLEAAAHYCAEDGAH